MIGIVIVAHGGLAREYLAAMEHVVGKSPGTAAVAIDADDDTGKKQAEVDAAVAAVDQGEGVVVVTDMFGSTPSNLAVRACRKTATAGCSTAPTCRCWSSSPRPAQAAERRGRSALTAGRKYINCIDGYGPNGTPIPL